MLRACSTARSEPQMKYCCCALDPEMRRIVGDVRKHRDKWPSRKCAAKTFAQRAIEVRHEGNHHVRLRFFPVRFEHPHRRPMIEPNHDLQHSHQLRAAERPARSQHPVVKILDADARVFLEDIECVEQFLQVGQANFPRPLLPADGHIKCRGCSAMAAACVEKTELDSSACDADSGNRRRRALRLPC